VLPYARRASSARRLGSSRRRGGQANATALYVITRTAHGEVLIVSGAGYDADARMMPRRPARRAGPPSSAPRPPSRPRLPQSSDLTPVFIGMHRNAPLSPMKEGARVHHSYGSYAPSSYGSYEPRRANPSTALPPRLITRTARGDARIVRGTGYDAAPPCLASPPPPPRLIWPAARAARAGGRCVRGGQGRQGWGHQCNTRGRAAVRH
jgi:hypothetical protein